MVYLCGWCDEPMLSALLTVGVIEEIGFRNHAPGRSIVVGLAALTVDLALSALLTV